MIEDRRHLWPLALVLLVLASCGNDEAGGSGEATNDTTANDAWDGPEITQETIDRFLEARPALLSGESIEELGLTEGTWHALDRAIKACLRVLRWQEKGGDAYIEELEAEVRALEKAASDPELDATRRRLRERDLAEKQRELDVEKEAQANLPSIPPEYLDVVRRNRDRLEPD